MDCNIVDFASEIIDAFTNCVHHDCYDCPRERSVNCRDDLCVDAQNLLEQIRENKKEAVEMVKNLRTELDAAKRDLVRVIKGCGFDDHACDFCAKIFLNLKECIEYAGCKPEWRGICDDNGGAANAADRC